MSFPRPGGCSPKSNAAVAASACCIIAICGGCGSSSDKPMVFKGGTSKNTSGALTLRDAPSRKAPALPPIEKGHSSAAAGVRAAALAAVSEYGETGDEVTVTYRLEHRSGARPFGARISLERPGRGRSPLVVFSRLSDAKDQTGKASLSSVPPGDGALRVRVVFYARSGDVLAVACTTTRTGAVVKPRYSTLPKQPPCGYRMLRQARSCFELLPPTSRPPYPGAVRPNGIIARSKASDTKVSAISGVLSSPKPIPRLPSHTYRTLTVSYRVEYRSGLRPVGVDIVARSQDVPSPEGGHAPLLGSGDVQTGRKTILFGGRKEGRIKIEVFADSRFGTTLGVGRTFIADGP